MPYIKQEDRLELKSAAPRTPGELNYEFTKSIVLYLDSHGLDYQTINDILGALTGATLEFNRRIVAPYEDKKIKENGDVY